MHKSAHQFSFSNYSSLAKHTIEPELESMKMMRAGMEEENHKMRRIISVYIQSSDLNDPAWDIMDEDDMGGKCFVFVFVCSFNGVCFFIGARYSPLESNSAVLVCSARRLTLRLRMPTSGSLSYIFFLFLSQEWKR
jgi:hypothetical protein